MVEVRKTSTNFLTCRINRISKSFTIGRHASIDDTNCEWGEWRISPCSRSCDGGKRHKIRYHEVIEGDPYHTYCSGGVQTLAPEDCNTEPCSCNNFNI